MHHGLDSLLYTALALLRLGESGNLLLGRASYLTKSPFVALKATTNFDVHMKCAY